MHTAVNINVAVTCRLLLLLLPQLLLLPLFVPLLLAHFIVFYSVSECCINMHTTF